VLLLSAVLGDVLVGAMLSAVSTRSHAFAQVGDGGSAAIPEDRIGNERSEFGRLFRQCNEMSRALDERERLARRLAEEEKLAVLGKLASGMAHEVNNPLGGLFTTVDTVRRHGDDPSVRERSLAILERGLRDISSVVRSALVTYKGARDPSVLSRSEIDDLQHLVRAHMARRHLRLEWSNALPANVDAPSVAIRQIALNLLWKACEAAPAGGVIRFDVRADDASVRLCVCDQGPGLPETMARLLTNPDPAAAPPEGRTGLGLWTAARLPGEIGGSARVDSPTDGGARLAIRAPTGPTPPIPGELDAVA